MSDATYLSYSDSVRFLEFVHHTFRWSIFLLKNAYNLTPGYAPIPSRNDRHDLAFEISDLKSLAYQFAKGKITQEHIDQCEGEFMNKMQHDYSANDIAPEEENEQLPLSSASYRIDQVIDDVVLLAKALYTIQIAIRTVGLHTDRTYEELEALGRVAEDYSGKAYKIAEALDEVQEILHEDEDDCAPNISDDELETLMGMLEAA